MSSLHFFSSLPSEKLDLPDLLEKTSHFSKIPDDWFVILTDIRKSSSHFAANHYREINLIAVSSISIVLNVSKKYDALIPFVYGGDGATLIVPPDMIEECLQRLMTLQRNAKKRFHMELRVFSMPIKDVEDAGFPIRVAKISVSPKYHQAVFIGEGLHYAEALMKQQKKYELPTYLTPLPVDLSGLECKWNALHPQRKGDEIICLIIQPDHKKDPHKVFANVLQKLDDMYGSFVDRHPIRPDTLSPTTHLKTILHASQLRYGHIHPLYLIKHIAIIFWSHVRSLGHAIKHVFIKRRPKKNMTTSSDTLKIDTTLKTIFAGDPAKREKFISWLDAQEKKGNLLYGINITDFAVMTCYIEEKDQAHIRFIDGFGGGYTRAAIELKKKIKKQK